MKFIEVNWSNGSANYINIDKLVEVDIYVRWQDKKEVMVLCFENEYNQITYDETEPNYQDIKSTVLKAIGMRGNSNDK